MIFFIFNNNSCINCSNKNCSLLLPRSKRRKENCESSWRKKSSLKMINNLFSIFDPSSCFSISLNWLALFGFYLILIPSFWLLTNPFKIILQKISRAIKKEFRLLLKNKKSNILVFLALFLLIIFNNTLGLVAFSFTSTRHLAITLALALPLWLGFILFSLFNKITDFLAHLVPLGTPAALMPFIVLIEIVRNLIRPITLSVRLAANIIAGHLLLTLLGNQVVRRSYRIFSFVIGAEFLLIVLESAVACIQAYVFSVLTTLYASEA